MAAIVAVLALLLVGCQAPAPPATPAPPRALTTYPLRTAEPPLPVLAPPADLPVIDYWPSPTGFAADPAPLSTVRLFQGLRPTERIALYDEPGGTPRAYLDPAIRCATMGRVISAPRIAGSR